MPVALDEQQISAALAEAGKIAKPIINGQTHSFTLSQLSGALEKAQVVLSNTRAALNEAQGDNLIYHSGWSAHDEAHRYAVVLLNKLIRESSSSREQQRYISQLQSVTDHRKTLKKRFRGASQNRKR